MDRPGNNDTIYISHTHNDGNDDDLMLNKSTNGGSSFSGGDIRSDGDADQFFHTSIEVTPGPDINADSDDNVYISYRFDKEDGTGDHDDEVRLMKSTNGAGGESDSAAVFISSSSAAMHGFPRRSHSWPARSPARR